MSFFGDDNNNLIVPVTLVFLILQLSGAKRSYNNMIYTTVRQRFLPRCLRQMVAAMVDLPRCLRRVAAMAV